MPERIAVEHPAMLAIAFFQHDHSCVTTPFRGACAGSSWSRSASPRKLKPETPPVLQPANRTWCRESTRSNLACRGREQGDAFRVRVTLLALSLVLGRRYPNIAAIIY